MSKNWRTSTSCSNISGTGASSIGRPGAESMICSRVCRCTRSCGLTAAKRSGRAPLGSSSNDRSKSSGWGGTGPGHLRSPWSDAVVTLGQGHGDAQTFVPKPLSESSLPPVSLAARAAWEICLVLFWLLLLLMLMLMLLLLLLLTMVNEAERLCQQVAT